MTNELAIGIYVTVLALGLLLIGAFEKDLDNRSGLSAFCVIWPIVLPVVIAAVVVGCLFNLLMLAGEKLRERFIS